MSTPNDTPKTIEIPLTRGYVTIVDEIDADLAEMSWNVTVATEYLQYATNAHYIMHRLIMERIVGYKLQSKTHVDHWNNNGLDNRRENLRIATPSQNGQNKRLASNSTTKYKGVNWHKYGKFFVARITVDGKRVFLGNYRTAIEAAIAYNRGAIKHFGEFAKLNEIEEWESVELRQYIVPSDNTSGYRGVSYRASRNEYRATFRRKELGTYDTAEEAYAAYLKARQEYDNAKR